MDPLILKKKIDLVLVETPDEYDLRQIIGDRTATDSSQWRAVGGEGPEHWFLNQTTGHRVCVHDAGTSLNFEEEDGDGNLFASWSRDMPLKESTLKIDTFPEF